MVDSEMSEAASPFSIQENGNEDTMADVQSSPAPEPATHAQQGNQDGMSPSIPQNHTLCMHMICRLRPIFWAECKKYVDRRRS
jgi:hypothetical protein